MKRFFISAIVAMGCYMAQAQSITIPAVNIAAGCTKSVNVSIPSGTDYTAFQFDIATPSGISLKSATINGPETREITSGKVGDKYRVLSYDMQNTKLTEDAVLSLTFEAEATVEKGETETDVDEIVIVDPNGNTAETTAGVVAFNVVDVETVKITSAGQAVICRDKNLDFSSVEDVKAYIATGHDKVSGKIWLTRVKDVPAGTAVLLMGDAGEYPIPVVSESKIIYENMLVGSLTATTVNKDGGNGMTNYILSKGDQGVGFYLAKESGSDIKAGGGYLPLPTTIDAVGEAGSEVTISMNKYGMKSYCPSQSLDFSDVDDLKAYTATGYTKSGLIRLTRVKLVPSGTGVLLLAPAEAKDYSVKTASLQVCYANMFEGTLTDKTIKQVEDDIVNYYVSVKDGVVGYYLASTSGTKISANGSWLPIPKSMTSIATARGNAGGLFDMPENLSISEDDDMISINVFRSIGGEDGETTGIRAVDSQLMNDVWYNLNGQRIDTPTKKGLYIKNGKKVIVK